MVIRIRGVCERRTKKKKRDQLARTYQVGTYYNKNNNNILED